MGIWAVPTFGYCEIMLPEHCWILFESLLSIHLGIEVGLLCHMIILWSTFWETKSLPEWLHHFTFSLWVHKDTNFSTSSQYSLILFFFLSFFFGNSHPNMCEAVPHCAFDLHFSNNQWYREYFHVLIGHLYVFFGEMSMCFLGLKVQHKEVPRMGWNQIYSYQPPMSQAQEQQFRTASVTYTTAHRNAGSLTHWARPGIKPVSSWILVRSINHWAMMGTPYVVLILALSLLRYGKANRCEHCYWKDTLFFFFNFFAQYFILFLFFSHCTARGSSYPYMYTLQLQFFPHPLFCCNMNI